MGSDFDDDSGCFHQGTRFTEMGNSVSLILNDTALAFIIDEGATRPSAAIAAEETSVASAVPGAASETAPKEQGSRYEETDNSSP